MLASTPIGCRESSSMMRLPSSKAWSKSVHTRPFVGAGYIYSQGGAGQSVKFPVEVNEAGPYQVLISYTPGTNRTQKANVLVPTADGPKTFVIDQQAAAGRAVLLSAAGRADAGVGQVRDHRLG